MPRLAMSRSYTSRPPRPGEADGVDYNFISRERFVAMIATRRSAGMGRGVRELLRDRRGGDRARALAAGDDLVLVIDVQGARKVRAAGFEHGRHLRAAAVLRGARGAAQAAQPGPRGANPAPAGGRARGGRTRRGYDYVVVNDEVDGCVDRLRAIVLAERSRLE